MHTIFLSYAHDDNQSPMGENFVGWVDFFDRALSIELTKQALAFELWRDKRDIDPVTFFDEVILDAVRDAPVFLALVSPCWVDSPYCLKEFEAFVSSHDGESGAIQKILIRDLDLALQPDLIRDKTGFKFFHIDQQENDEIPFFDGFGEHLHRDYWKGIRQLGKSINNQLAAIKSTITAENALVAVPDTVPAIDNDIITLYLAVTSHDLLDRWQELRDELESHGYRVVPQQPLLPLQQDQVLQGIKEEIQSASMAIHLIGQTGGYTPDGNTPDGAAQPIVHQQFDLVASHRQQGADIKRIVWLEKNLQVKEPGHKSFIEKLQTYQDIQPDDEVLNGEPFEDLKTTVLDTLLAIKTTSIVPAPVEPAQQKIPLIYLYYAQQDLALMTPVYNILVDAGVEVVLPDFESDADTRAQHQAAQLQHCDAVLLHYGSQTYADFQQQLMILQGRDLAADNYPGTRTGVTAVILAAPESGQKSLFRSPAVDTVINVIKGADSTMFQPFIDRLKTRTADIQRAHSALSQRPGNHSPSSKNGLEDTDA